MPLFPADSNAESCAWVDPREDAGRAFYVALEVLRRLA